MTPARASQSSGAEARRIAAEGLPSVVLVGRANAGKSTLFNRIAKGGRAITSSIPGTTRDLNFARAAHDGREFVVVDSGGLELGGRERMTERIVGEALAAVGVAGGVVFIFAGRGGATAAAGRGPTPRTSRWCAKPDSRSLWLSTRWIGEDRKPKPLNSTRSAPTNY